VSNVPAERIDNDGLDLGRGHAGDRTADCGCPWIRAFTSSGAR
jgi:hypothetical protein